MAAQKFDMAPVDAAFRKLCSILFGREVGGLLEFEPYLKEAMLPYTIAKSGAGQEVFISSPYYPKGERFVGPDEAAAASAA